MTRPVNQMPPVHPGEILREDYLLPLGMSANALANALGVPATRIHEIIKERRAVTADTAQRLARYFGGDAASLAIDAQQFAFDHMAKKLARHVDRHCTVIRLPSEKVPAAINPYLGLDDTRDKAIQALIDQARTDANMANSKCAYADTDSEAALICALFESMPEQTKSIQ